MISKIEEPPTDLDFSNDYSGLPEDDQEYVESLVSGMDKRTEAILKFAKVELSLLSKRFREASGLNE